MARRKRPSRVSIRIDGRVVDVERGTSVAVALLNSGVKRFRASEGGSPRGPLCAMGICFECRVTIDGIPHRRACMEECVELMEIRTLD